jgi:hypothetical protein
MLSILIAFAFAKITPCRSIAITRDVFFSRCKGPFREYINPYLKGHTITQDDDDLGRSCIPLTDYHFVMQQLANCNGLIWASSLAWRGRPTTCRSIFVSDIGHCRRSRGCDEWRWTQSSFSSDFVKDHRWIRWPDQSRYTLWVYQVWLL